MRIGILSAGDRNNYGDILFPIIFQKYFEDISNIEFINYGITKANLEYFGGFKTKEIFDILEERVDSIIISGGDTLAASWTSILLSYERKEHINFLLRGIKKCLGMKGEIFNRNIICNLDREKIRKCKDYKFPFNIPRTILGKNIKIIYNSVGGSRINKLSLEYQQEIGKVLNDADYISVRDEKTKKNLEKLNIKLPIKSFPDSAMIISDIFKENILNELLSEEFKSNYFKELDKKEYIVFQIAKQHVKGKIEIIVKELEKLYMSKRIKIVLLPIGQAAYHSDQVPLKEIYMKLKEKIDIIYIDTKNIYDVMYVLANTTLYLGTSLHGAITAFSYGRRHVALTSKISKQREFLKTWSLGDIYLEIEDISKDIDLYLYQNIEEIKRKSKIAKEKVKENYEQIRRIMLG